MTNIAEMKKKSQHTTNKWKLAVEKDHLQCLNYVRKYSYIYVILIIWVYLVYQQKLKTEINSNILTQLQLLFFYFHLCCTTCNWKLLTKYVQVYKKGKTKKKKIMAGNFIYQKVTI